ncbi:MAG: YigZ family protein [Pseudomonadota bacterium]
MSDEPCFFSIDAPREMTLKVRRSQFTCRLQSVDSLELAKAFISTITKANRTATHNCWAYLLGDQGEVFHSSDAGEPSGTAGKPILHTLQSHNMTHVAAVVTRIFGGVKLGVKGLMDAYAESVQAAIDMAPLKRLVKLAGFKVEVAYDFNDMFLARINPFLNKIADTGYSEKIVHHIQIELKHLAKAEHLLCEYQSQGKLTFTPIRS